MDGWMAATLSKILNSVWVHVKEKCYQHVTIRPTPSSFHLLMVLLSGYWPLTSEILNSSLISFLCHSYFSFLRYSLLNFQSEHMCSPSHDILASYTIEILTNVAAINKFKQLQSQVCDLYSTLQKQKPENFQAALTLPDPNKHIYTPGNAPGKCTSWSYLWRHIQ